MSEILTISVENVKFFAYHGVFEMERVVGNEFEVSLSVEMSMPESLKDDNLSDTISYADIFQIIRTEMEIPSCLIEHVAYRIVQKIRNKWDQIKKGEIKITKVSPPIEAFTGNASVKINF